MNCVSDNKYKGNVKIEFLRGSKPYKTIYQHNEGTVVLFRYLANALAGNLSTASVPKYLHTFYSSELYDPESGNIRSEVKGNDLYGNTATCKSTCSENIPYGNIEVNYDATLNGGDGGYVTKFTFMIPYAYIWGKTNVLAIYNTPSYGNGVTPIAYIKLTQEQSEAWNLEERNTSNIKVTWSMTITN